MSEAPVQAWPATLEEFWSWHMQAACRQVDTNLFYSPEGERGPRKERREAAAKQVCGLCKVKELCAAYAIATREPYGTWGGLSEQDRRELLRDMDPRMAQLRYRTALAAWERQVADAWRTALRPPGGVRPRTTRGAQSPAPAGPPATAAASAPSTEPGRRG